MDLFPTLGNQENVDEYLGIIIVIEKNNLVSMSPTLQARGEKLDDSSHGPFGSGADWMFYGPVARRAVGESETQRLAASARYPITDGHMVDFNFSMDPDGWVDEIAGTHRNNDSQDMDAGVDTYAEVDTLEDIDAEMVES